jgi:predicted Zn-dependent protease
MPAEGNALCLMHYLRARHQPFPRETLKNLNAFHRVYGPKKILSGIVYDWVRHSPEDREALRALAQAQKADGQLESAMATLRLLLIDEPPNPLYLMIAADVELAFYQLQRSYLNHASNEPTLTLIARPLQLDQNPQNAFTSQLLRELPKRKLSLIALLAKD